MNTKCDLQAKEEVGFASKGPSPNPVLFVVSSLTIGGSERKTIRIVNELHRTGWNVHLAYLNRPETLLDDVRQGVPIVFLNRKGKISLASIRRLRAYIQQANISCIVCINLYPLIYAQAARYLLPENSSPRLIVTVNSTEHLGAKDSLAMQIYRPLMKYADKIVFGCQVQMERWCARYGFKNEQCDVIYNGVDEEKFTSDLFNIHLEETKAGRSTDLTEFVVGTVGQLRPVKNQVELILALAHLKDKFPHLKLVIVGDGSERSHLENVVHEMGLDGQVRFLGEIDDVRPILKQVDLFVLPSISETFSNAALEAMAMGKTVILSDTGGAREMVEDRVSGFVYKRGDTRALAELIEQLIGDPARRRAIGENARATVLEKFTFGRMISEYEHRLR